MEQKPAIDITAAVRPGVYILRERGRVVFVGAGTKPLVRLYAHLTRRRGEPAPAWLPLKPIAFDSIELRPCLIDQLPAHYAAVCEELSWSPPVSKVIDWRTATAGA